MCCDQPATYEINSPDDLNSADGTANSWVNTGVDRTIYMEVRVKKSDGVCHMDLTVRTPPNPRSFTFSVEAEAVHIQFWMTSTATF